MSGGRLLSAIGLSMSICALALPAGAMADVNVEGEGMTWPANSGAVQQDGGNTVYHLTVNGTGTSTVTTSAPTALLSVRLRTEQTGTFCQGQPQFSVYANGSKRAQWTLAAGATYTTFTVDIDGQGNNPIGVGSNTVGVSLDNEQSGLLGCDRGLFVDRLTLTTRPTGLFSTTSWANQPLPDTLPPTDQSPKQALLTQVQVHGTFVNDYDNFSVPVYTVRADQPTSKIYQDERWQKYFDADAVEWDNQMGAVPIPSNAKSSGPCDGTGDGETYQGCGSHDWGDRDLVVYQPSTDTLWELYHLIKHNSHWAATDGCRISNASTNPVTCDVQPFPSRKLHGIAATRIPVMATLQRTREVMALQINHAITIHLPHVKGPGNYFVAPALATDGDFMTDDAVQEGTRFRLPAGYNVNALPTPYLRAFAKAVRDYGMIVTDKDCHNTWLDPKNPREPSCDADPHSAAVTTIVEDPAPTYGTTDPYANVIGQQW